MPFPSYTFEDLPSSTGPVVRRGRVRVELDREGKLFAEVRFWVWLGFGFRVLGDVGVCVWLGVDFGITTMAMT